MIELKAKSENYIPKVKLEGLVTMLEESENPNDHVNAKVLSELLDKDFEVTIEVAVDSIVDAAKAQNEESKLEASVLDNLADDDTIEWEFEKRDLAKPLLASDFNSYDFKRKMCDFFETGYHVDSFDLVRMFAEKLQVDYLL